MSFFGIGDIDFLDKGKNGSLLNNLIRNQFSVNTYKYPVDLGSYDKGHYIMFFIRQPSNTQYPKDGLGGNILSPIMNQISGGVNQVSGIINKNIVNTVGKLDNIAGTSFAKGISNSLTGAVKGIGKTITGGINGIFGAGMSILGGDSSETQNIIGNSLKSITGGSFNFTKQKMTSDVISLYMPDTLHFQHNQEYDDLQLGHEVGGRIAAAVRSMADAYRNGGEEAAASSAVTSAANTFIEEGAIRAAGNSGRIGSAAVLGVVSNPLLELIYHSPRFRSFQFEFMFYPRDSQEAREVQSIIESFRFHQAPEILQEAQGFLIPPSEFDIKMYCNGTENPNIPQIATCVLDGMNIDYAPSGFSAYEIPAVTTPSLGGTGMPVAIRLTLSFKEITYLTKSDFNTDI
jgi:hypothetical protein